MSFDLDAYLARIALPARPTQDAFGVEAMQRAHRLAIPFENLDIRLGRPIRIDSDSVFAKLVTAKRGGYCFEQNRLFRDALTALGFDPKPLLARVWLGSGAPGDAVDTSPLTHTLVLLDLGGEAWIADAGFGGGYGPAMPLVDGAEAVAPDGATYRLTRDPVFHWVLWRTAQMAGDAPVAQFSFAAEPVAESDLALSNHWTSTAPGTRFVTMTMATIPLPRGFANLIDREYLRIVGTEVTKATIEDPRVYRMRLSLMFGLDLSTEEVETLWAGL